MSSSNPQYSNEELPVFVEVRPNIFVQKEKLTSKTDYKEYIQYKPGYFVPKEIPLSLITKDTPLMKGYVGRFMNSSISPQIINNSFDDTRNNINSNSLLEERKQPREISSSRVPQSQENERLLQTHEEIRERKPVTAEIDNKKESYGQQKENESTCSKLCKTFSLFHLIGFILAFIIFILALDIHATLNDNNSEAVFFRNLADQWRRAPISGISKADQNLTCPSKDSEVIPFSFDGFEKGCNCNGVITKGACSQSDCTEIPEVLPRKVFNWEGGALCEKSLKYINQTEEEDYFSLFIVPSKFNGTSPCPNDYTVCGKIDSFENLLCVPQGNACPVNNLKVTNFFYNKEFSFDNANIAEKEVPEEKKINTTIQLKNADFKFSNTNDPLVSRIPVNFRIGYDVPCINPYYENAKFNMYVLDPFYGKQKCLKFANEVELSKNITTFSESNQNKSDLKNTNFTVVDFYNYKNFISDNQIFENNTYIPVGLNDQLYENLALSTSNYPGINADCHKDIRENGFAERIYETIKNLENLSSIRSSMLVIVILSIISFLIILFFLICEVFVKVNRTKTVLYTILWILLVALLIILIVALVFVTTNTSKIYNIYGLNYLFNSSCIDPVTYDLYNFYFGFITACKTLIVIVVILVIILIVLYLIFFYFALTQDWFINENH